VNSQQLIIINLIIGLLLLAYFLVGVATSKQKPPTRLNLRAGDEPASEDLPEVNPRTKTMKALPPPRAVGEDANAAGQIKEDAAFRVAAEKARDLSLYFIYNGHDWEAHDVLGVPRGAPLSQVTEVYQALLKTSDPSTFEFFDTAYKTLLRKHRKDRL
jgi:hypothetical protein